jgi:hypothetical protein
MFLGIEIGGTKLQIGLGPGDGQLNALWRGHVDLVRGGDGPMLGTYKIVFERINRECPRIPRIPNQAVFCRRRIRIKSRRFRNLAGKALLTPCRHEHKRPAKEAVLLDSFYFGQMPAGKLYKMIDQPYLQSFKKNGLIRIGTLNAYRESEDHRRDDKEGWLEAQIQPEKTPVVLSFAQTNSLLGPNTIFRGNSKAKVFIGPGANWKTPIRFKYDAYVFCVSECVMVPEFANAHYAITHPLAFGHMLFGKLKEVDDELFHFTLGAVQYGGAKEVATCQQEAEALVAAIESEPLLQWCLLKPKSYSHEREYRYVFFTKKLALPKYTDLTCDPELAKQYCEFTD